MLLYALIVFLVGACGGLVLASFVLRGKLAPWAVYTDFSATWRPIRVGRQVDAVEIRFAERDQGGISCTAKSFLAMPLIFSALLSPQS